MHTSSQIPACLRAKLPQSKLLTYKGKYSAHPLSLTKPSYSSSIAKKTIQVSQPNTFCQQKIKKNVTPPCRGVALAKTGLPRRPQFPFNQMRRGLKPKIHFVIIFFTSL
jgi:hypothetical protein